MSRTTVRSSVQLMLLDVWRFARPRAFAACVLVVLGSVLEAAGILLLVPLVQSLLGDTGEVFQLLQQGLSHVGLSIGDWQVGDMLIAFGFLVTLRFAVLFLRDVETARLRVDFIAALRARAFRSLPGVPWSDLAGRGHGRIGHALVRDVDRVSQAVNVVLTAGLALLQIAVQLSVSLIFAPLITLGVAAFGAGVFLALRTLRRRAVRHGAQLTEADYELFNTATTYLRGLKHARAHGLEAEYASAFDRAARRVAAHHLRQERDYTFARLALQTMVALAGLAVVFAGTSLLAVEPERLIVVILILARLSGPFQTVQAAMQQIGHAAPAYGSLCALTEGPQNRPDDPGSAQKLDRAPTIRFREVSFAASGADLLTDIECEIAAGRVTGLVGPSGAGKSLFCELAIGLIEPQSGRVEIDGQVLDEALLPRFRASIAYVSQEPFLLEESLRANLTWGCGDVSDDAVWAALEAVGATALASHLDGGLGGSMRAGGSRFSGGERQRFRLAHAILRRPSFMILDEATNALDADAEMSVLRGVRRGLPETTILMVTHRVSSLEITDRVLVLERGSLVWAGAPARLASHERIIL